MNKSENIPDATNFWTNERKSDCLLFVIIKCSISLLDIFIDKIRVPAQ